MKVISEPNKSVLMIMKRFLGSEKSVRWSQYCVITPTADGFLVFNLLTRELIFLNNDEYSSFSHSDYLRDHGFVLPENTNEKELADFVKLVLSTQQKKPSAITNFTIFTTTDCNARCFYCFELGRSRIPMSCDTAKKVIGYIKDHCGGNKVRIGWFGGEPLFNSSVIDIIANGLHNEKIDFTSYMISNGYLFDNDIVCRAAECWNLKNVQISLDGTEKVYNKIKSYIYPGTNPFEIVMDNIERLLDNGIHVSIRLNMDVYNSDDLLALAKELGCRFKERNGINVYAHHLFKSDTPDAVLYSEEEWAIRNAAMERLYNVLDEYGLISKGGIAKSIKTHHCMADSGNAITILPDGNLGLCEHCTETEFIGHLDQQEFDKAVVESWKERVPQIPECAECFYYLDCIKLKKCSTSRICYPQYRQKKLKDIQRAMIFEYDNWLKPKKTDKDYSIDIC